MIPHTLPRTGDAPVTFSGSLLAESDGRMQSGRDHNRYHNIALYRTDGGSYVVSISYRTMWEGEQDQHTVETRGSAAEAVEVLREYDPTDSVMGFPPGAAYAEKQARLLRDIETRYDAQVSELLAEHSDLFAERIA